MTRLEALKLVLELAVQEMLTDEEARGSTLLRAEQERQAAAVAKVRRHLASMEKNKKEKEG